MNQFQDTHLFKTSISTMWDCGSQKFLHHSAFNDFFHEAISQKIIVNFSCQQRILMRIASSADLKIDINISDWPILKTLFWISEMRNYYYFSDLIVFDKMFQPLYSQTFLSFFSYSVIRNNDVVVISIGTILTSLEAYLVLKVQSHLWQWWNNFV